MMMRPATRSHADTRAAHAQSDTRAARLHADAASGAANPTTIEITPAANPTAG